MTKDEFKPIAKKLSYAYMREDFLNSGQQLSLWHTMLEDLDAERVDRAATAYIKKNHYPPTIADIRAEYSRLKSADSEFRAQMMEIYDETRGLYPCSYDSPKARATWKAAVKSLSRAVEALKPMDAAWSIRRVTARHVANHEKAGKVDLLPDWIDYLEGIENWGMKQN